MWGWTCKCLLMQRCLCKRKFFQWWFSYSFWYPVFWGLGGQTRRPVWCFWLFSCLSQPVPVFFSRMPFCCEPGWRSFTCYSISMGVSRLWLSFHFWANCCFSVWGMIFFSPLRCLSLRLPTTWGDTKSNIWVLTRLKPPWAKFTSSPSLCDSPVGTNVANYKYSNTQKEVYTLHVRYHNGGSVTNLF